MDDGEHPKNRGGGLLGFFKALGPGLITGAADDDPSGIATYAQTGAQFGYGQLWTALYQIPLLIAVQEASARIGAATGAGLAEAIKSCYSKKVLIPYKAYARVLKWLALALLSYAATALIVQEPWQEILRSTLIPHIEFSFSFLFIITGVFGTSISPYMFFWQASEEVEEQQALKVPKGRDGRPRLTKAFIRNMRIDTVTGMVAAEVAQWFIIITTATVLFSHGQKTINSAADAAKALEPLVRSFPNSGQVARDLFAVGVVGLGLLGIPVLAGSAAYGLSEAFGWKAGLSKTFRKAPAFYGVIIVSTLTGLAMNFIGIDPFKALVVSAVINGIAAVPLLYVIARLNGNRKVLGEHVGGLLSRAGVWLTFLVMALSAIALVVTTFWKPAGA